MTVNQAPEVVPAVVQPDSNVVAVDPTQVRRPWRSTARTIFQGAVALATLIPFVVTDVYESPDAYPAVVVQVLAVSGVVTRVMANPKVELFLRQFAPFLAAAPAAKTGDAR